AVLQRAIQCRYDIRPFEFGDSALGSSCRKLSEKFRSRLMRGRTRACVLFAAGITAAALAGCGSSGSSSQPSSAANLSGQTLSVYTQAPYGTQLNNYKQYYSYIANQFHKETGSTIQWIYTSSAVTLSQELEQAAASGTGPDVWSIGSSFN